MQRKIMSNEEIRSQLVKLLANSNRYEYIQKLKIATVKAYMRAIEEDITQLKEIKKTRFYSSNHCRIPATYDALFKKSLNALYQEGQDLGAYQPNKLCYECQSRIESIINMLEQLGNEFFQQQEYIQQDLAEEKTGINESIQALINQNNRLTKQIESLCIEIKALKYNFQALKSEISQPGLDNKPALENNIKAGFFNSKP